MPRGDGTGPMGMGSMTGRGAGFCAGYAAPGYANPAGYGRGFRRMFYASGMPVGARLEYPVYAGTYEQPALDEKEILSRQAEILERRLEQLKKRLSGFKEDSE